MIEYPYYMSARILSRSKGHNALAAAAYRAGQRLQEGEIDQRYLREHFKDIDNQKPVAQNKQAHDYSRRGGVMSSFILTPKEAPIWMARRENLWNAVEQSEKRKDSQIAREMIISLPDIDLFNHLKPENKQKRLQEFYERVLKQYVKDNFISEGMIADVALHMPAEKNDHRHYHAHIMLTTRYVDQDGFGAKAREWNAPEKLESWRQNWAILMNDTLRQNGLKGFIDHRSYEERGLDIAATKPLGPHYSKLEHFGIETPPGNDNRKIRAENRAGHKYLEKVFEHAPSASEEAINAALEREGFGDVQAMKHKLEEEGIIIPLYSKETGKRSHLYSYKPMQERADSLKKMAQRLYERHDFALPDTLVQTAIDARGDKLVRDALSYTAGAQGFKVIEAEDNGHKTTYMNSIRDLYSEADYDVVAVARNNQGKDHFKKAGFNKGVLTYRDFLRRFGERYTGEKSQKKKVILVDEAEQLSPLQDQEIFKTAQKIGAKLIYIGASRKQKKRGWQSMFSFYKMMSAYKKLRHKFMKSGGNSQTEFIRSSFEQARTLNALKMQGPKYLHAHDNNANAKQALLQLWFKDMKQRDDKRFILCAKDKDMHLFNRAIQKERLRKKQLKEKSGRAFIVSYLSDQGSALTQDVSVYHGDMIQFKKSYTDHKLEEGSRARILIHYSDYSVLETEDGRVIKVNLKKYNAFDLGYAGRKASEGEYTLEKAYMYHDGKHSLDDAPLLYQKTEQPVHIFYDRQRTEDLHALSTQLLGRRHNILQGFAAISGLNGDNDNEAYEDLNEIEEDELKKDNGM